MANTKISALTALTGANVAPDDDVLAIVDTSVTTTKKITVTEFRKTMRVVQVVEGTPYTTNTDISALIPTDDTIPQNTEGTELVTVTITPISTTNRLRIEWDVFGGLGSAGSATVALFQDSTANALAARGQFALAGEIIVIYGSHEMAAGTTSATTFKIRAGPNSNAVHFYTNGFGAGNRLYGGVASCRLRVTEIYA